MKAPWIGAGRPAAPAPAAVMAAGQPVTFPHRARCPFHCQRHQGAGTAGVFMVS